MIDIRHLGAALDYTEKDFDAALIRTRALTLASEAFARGAGRFGDCISNRFVVIDYGNPPDHRR